MRFGLATALLVLATAAPTVAAARTPMTLLLAEAHGRGSVTISAGTAHLHNRVWLYRQGGTGTAKGKASVTCQGKMTDAGKGVTWQWFNFKLAPSARTEIWRYTSPQPCTLTVSLTGKGLLTVTLRGY